MAPVLELHQQCIRRATLVYSGVQGEPWGTTLVYDDTAGPRAPTSIVFAATTDLTLLPGTHRNFINLVLVYLFPLLGIVFWVYDILLLVAVDRNSEGIPSVLQKQTCPLFSH